MLRAGLRPSAVLDSRQGRGRKGRAICFSRVPGACSRDQLQLQLAHPRRLLRE